MNIHNAVSFPDYRWDHVLHGAHDGFRKSARAQYLECIISSGIHTVHRLWIHGAIGQAKVSKKVSWTAQSDGFAGLRITNTFKVSDGDDEAQMAVLQRKNYNTTCYI